MIKALLAFACLGHPQTQPPIRMLFIGNSAIYFHNLPQILKQIAGSGRQPISIETEMISEGGQTLEGHWAEGQAQREIRSKRWDYVVLQEQSGLGDELKIDGKWAITGWESYQRYAKLFDAEAKAVGAKTVILSLWCHKGTPPREQVVLDYASESLAAETGAILVPAGAVWHAVEKVDPALKLYWDGFHPMPVASYMFAATLYASVFHRDPADLTNKAIGNDIDIANKLGTDPMAVIAEVPANTATEIKQIAFAVVRRRSRPLAPPQGPILPSLPAGGQVSIAKLQGKWVGTVMLFREEPHPFTLVIHADGDKILVDTRYELDPPIEETANAGAIGDHYFTFVNPKGVDGTDIKYRAVLNGDTLTGITEVRRANELLAIAKWSLVRQTQR